MKTKNKKALGALLVLIILVSLIIFLLNIPERPQIHFDAPWGDKKCAVALTYDDALNAHLDNVIPVLDSLDFTGTFYVYGTAASFDKRLHEWKSIAADGHELANHTLFHPCNGKTEGNNWVKPEYDLSNYTLGRITDEIRLANTLLKAADGKKKRTFAYPCGDKMVGDTSYVSVLKKDFVAARGTTPGMNQINEVDLFNIKAYGIGNGSAEELIKLAKKAEKEQALLVIIFHGVGGEHKLNISLPEHNKFMNYLKKNEKDIWIAPMVEIAEYIKQFNVHKEKQNMNQ